MKKIILILTVFLLCIYGFLIEPNMLTVTNYQLQDKQLSGLKVVFVGDWHIKPSQEKRLQKVVKVINEQNPDLVLSVGDYVSGHNSSMTMPMEQITVNLKQIHSTYGFYTVLGNHDWWTQRNVINNKSKNLENKPKIKTTKPSS